MAQFLLSRRESWIDGLLLYGVALFLLVRGLRQLQAAASPFSAPHERLVEADRPLPAKRWARQARLLVGFLAVAAFFGFGGNQLGGLPSIVLLAAGGAYAYLFWRPTAAGAEALPRHPDRFLWERGWSLLRWSLERLGQVANPQGLAMHISWRMALLLGIVGLGALMRFARLAEVPLEMISDHAEKFLDIEAIREGARPIFFPTNSGREGTQLYLAAILSNLTGYTYLTLKLVTCTASLLTIPFVYLLGRTLYGSPVGLVAAFLLAISQWDVSIARLSTRATFAVLWSTISLYLAYRALARREHNAFLLLGLAMGLGLYGYTSFRVVPVFVGLLVAAFVVLDPGGRRRWRQVLRQAAMAYGLTAILAIPLARYVVDFPQQFFLRTATRLTESEAPIEGGLLPTFLGNLWNTALMFNWQGDRSWVQQAPGQPMLDWVTGALFAVGIAYAGYRALAHRDVLAGTLIAGVLILTLPSTLALAFPIEHPHQNRANPALPLVMVLAALPAKLAIEQLWLAARSPVVRLGAVAVPVALAAAATQANVHNYFIQYAAVHQAHSLNHREVAGVVGAFTQLAGTTRSAYIVVWPHWLDHRLVALELGDFAWRETALLSRAEGAALHADRPEPKLYVLHRDDGHSIEVLRGVYPQAIIREHPSQTPGRAFRTMFVPG